MANKAAFSDKGLPYGAAVDVDALSDVARRRALHLTVQGSAWVQNATTKHNLGTLGMAGIVRGAYLSQGVLVSAGTASGRLVAYNASANAEVNLTDTVNPEAATAREGQAFTLATTNVALAADDTLEFHAIADNNAVSGGTGVTLTVIFEPTETTPPTR